MLDDRIGALNHTRFNEILRGLYALLNSVTI